MEFFLADSKDCDVVDDRHYSSPFPALRCHSCYRTFTIAIHRVYQLGSLSWFYPEASSIVVILLLVPGRRHPVLKMDISLRLPPSLCILKSPSSFP